MNGNRCGFFFQEFYLVKCATCFLFSIHPTHLLYFFILCSTCLNLILKIWISVDLFCEMNGKFYSFLSFFQEFHMQPNPVICLCLHPSNLYFFPLFNGLCVQTVTWIFSPKFCFWFLIMFLFLYYGSYSEDARL